MRKSVFSTTFSFSDTSSAQILRGRVVRVSDGDIIALLDADNTQQKIRLNE